MGVQKGSLYAHIDSKQDLLYEAMREGADRSTPGWTRSRTSCPRSRRSGARCARTSRSSAPSSTSRPCSCREWKYLQGHRREEIIGERRRYEERIRALFREGRELGELRTDLDDATAALLLLSAANWAYTWLVPGRDTDELADRFFDLLVNGMRGYATPE